MYKSCVAGKKKALFPMLRNYGNRANQLGEENLPDLYTKYTPKPSRGKVGFSLRKEKKCKTVS